MPQLVGWECNNISVQLRVRYGSRLKELNVLHVLITNRSFELLPEDVQSNNNNN